MTTSYSLSVEAVKAADDKGAVTLIKRAAKNYRAAVEGTRTRTVDAAYATWLAQRTGYLSTQRGSGVKSAKEYAVDFDVAESTITLWKRLGHVLVDLELDPSSTLFRRLAFTGAGTNSEIGKAIAAAKSPADVPALQEAYDALYDETGAKKSGPRVPDGSTGGGDAGDDVALAAKDLAAMGRCKVALKVLSESVSELDAADWSTVETALQAIVTKEVTIRMKASKAAAEAAKSA